MLKFSDAEKLTELDREILLRHRTYRTLIRAGKMHPDTAQYQLAVLLEIANDYRAKVMQGPLFDRKAS